MKNKILATVLSLAVCCGAIVSPVRATVGEAAEEREVVVVRHLFSGICSAGVDHNAKVQNGVYIPNDPIVEKELADAGFARARHLDLEGYANTDALYEFVGNLREGMLYDKNSPYYGNINRMNSDECVANIQKAKASSANSSVIARFKTKSLSYENLRSEALAAVGSYPVDEHYIDSRFGGLDEIEFVEDSVELQGDCVAVLNIVDWRNLVYEVEIEDWE